MSRHHLLHEIEQRALAVATTSPETWQFTTELNGRAFVDGGKVYEVIAGIRAVTPFPTGLAFQVWGANPAGSIRRGICNKDGIVTEVCRYA